MVEKEPSPCLSGSFRIVEVVFAKADTSVSGAELFVFAI
jgi:hypothetical protein